jgi:hypothetical protein
MPEETGSEGFERSASSTAWLFPFPLAGQDW